MTLGPLLDRVPVALRGASAYHVPQPPVIHAKLDANELPHAWPPELRARLGQALANVSLERYPDPRARELRTILASQLQVDPNQLTFGNGSDELIAMLCAAFAGPILYPVPTFVYYKLAATARGLPTIEIPLDDQFQLDAASLEWAIVEHKPSVVFLALPNNPTGTLWPLDTALQLAARHRDTVIVSDEAYLAYSGRTNLAALAQHPNLVVMRTLSKVGLAGLRVGFTIASPAIAELLEKVRPPYNLSSLDQAAAVFALTEALEWCATSAHDVVVERARLATALATYGEVFPSEANLILVRFGAGRAAEIWKQLADRGIVVRNFDQPGPLAGCLRITVGTAAENDLLLRTLADL
ncbi:MAG: histidinol-phosphate transaminase [Kofleriaceae bacterium]